MRPKLHVGRPGREKLESSRQTRHAVFAAPASRDTAAASPRSDGLLQRASSQRPRPLRSGGLGGRAASPRVASAQFTWGSKCCSRQRRRLGPAGDQCPAWPQRPGAAGRGADDDGRLAAWIQRAAAKIGCPDVCRRLFAADADRPTSIFGRIGLTSNEWPGASAPRRPPRLPAERCCRAFSWGCGRRQPAWLVSIWALRWRIKGQGNRGPESAGTAFNAKICFFQKETTSRSTCIQCGKHFIHKG